MSRVRVSTTVDAELLEQARQLGIADTDASLLDKAFGALVARHRAGEIDLSYEAYDRHPLAEPDDWGDLASFRRKAAESR